VEVIPTPPEWGGFEQVDMSADGQLAIFSGGGSSNVHVPFVRAPFGASATVYDVNVTDGRGTGTAVFPRSLRGDANGDGVRSVADVFYDINALFAGGVAPASPCRSDVNGDGHFDVSDVFYLINFAFAGGAPPPPC
jgi:hypothetical protein